MTTVTTYNEYIQKSVFKVRLTEVTLYNRHIILGSYRTRNGIRKCEVKLELNQIKC